MSKFSFDHQVYADTLRKVAECGKLVVPCGKDRTDALALRTRLYTFFKYLERQENDQEALELLEIRKIITIGAYKNGELIIEKRTAAQTLAHLTKVLAMSNERARVGEKGLMDELNEVDTQAEVLQKGRQQEEEDRKAREEWVQAAPRVLSEEDWEEISQRAARDKHYVDIKK